MIPYLLLAELQNTVLAAILTLSDRVIYPVYLTVPRTETITALEDQSVAGVIMWVPGSLVFLVAAVGVVMETLGARGQAALQGRLVESEGLVGTQSGPRCTPAFLANAPFRGVVQGIGWANQPDDGATVGVLPEVRRTLNWVRLSTGEGPWQSTDPDHPGVLRLLAPTAEEAQEKEEEVDEVEIKG